MARVETGHIHLGSSILHHTEGWETKSLKKWLEHTETQGQLLYGHTCVYACTQTHKQGKKATLLGPSLAKTHATMQFTV